MDPCLCYIFKVSGEFPRQHTDPLISSTRTMCTADATVLRPQHPQLETLNPSNPRLPKDKTQPNTDPSGSESDAAVTDPMEPFHP